MATDSADFETGDLSQFDNTSIDGGDFSAHADAAMAGSWGGKFVVDDTNAIYGRIAWANKTRLRVGLYFDTNGLTMAGGDQFFLVSDDNLSSDYTLQLYHDGSNYKLRLRVKLDSASWSSNAEVTITDAAHWVEIDMTIASGVGANDGFAKIWVDSDVEGAPDASVTGLDNDTLDFDGVIIGACGGLDAGTSGTFYMDHLQINDTGDSIGPPAAPGGTVPPLYYHYRHH